MRCSLEDRMHARLSPLIALATLSAVAGCTLPGQPSADEIARAQEAIINGKPSGTDDDAAILIPLFQNGQFFGACSGVMIAANLVLTARHCVSQTDEGAICDADGTPLYGGVVYSDRPAKDLGVITGAALKNQLDASGMQIFTTGADTLCNNDIALVLLDKPITTVPIAQLRLDGPPTVGEQFRAVGWGLSNNSSGYGRRMRDNVSIEAVGPATDTAGVGGVSPNEFEVGEAICQGDSGGPAFDETTKAVVGVVSRGGNGKMPSASDPPYAGCVNGSGLTALNLYTRVDGFADLFTQAFAAAGTDPWREGGPDPRKAKTGDACMAGDACQSGICVDPTKTGYCSQTCDGTPSSCPSGMSCKKDSGLQICKLPSKGCAMAPGAHNDEAPLAALLLLAAAFLLRRRAVS
jgi:MYXO-CTERM domain-containing protein